MRLERRLGAAPVPRRLGFLPGQPSCLLQRPPDGRRTDSLNVSVKHHERQPPVPAKASEALPTLRELAGSHTQPMSPVPRAAGRDHQEPIPCSSQKRLQDDFRMSHVHTDRRLSRVPGRRLPSPSSRYRRKSHLCRRPLGDGSIYGEPSFDRA
jgi:hypothetical protein